MTTTDAAKPHFIHELIDKDIESGKWGSPGDNSVVATRFPPEPNGYLHVGHAKSITLNFTLAAKYRGRCYLRFDDTNPAKEDQEYVDSIIRDVQWLGFQWTIDPSDAANKDHPETPPGVKFASDYFRQMHDYAVELINKDLAYVDEQSADEIRKSRGTLTAPGTPSPFRDRPIAESLELFSKMTTGNVPDGNMVLRAKIDMASPNMNLRDPVMYRVVRAPHHRTGTRWSVYPMYDWAHGIEDSIEKITHSICTLEFENHRPLYDWFINAINKNRSPSSPLGKPIHHPQQIEFARLRPTYTITSKRFLRQLVEDKHVAGWDDPRMPTVAAMRRRGYTPKALRDFVMGVGTTKFNASHDITLLENATRDHLNKAAHRRMAVLNPLKVTITNWPTNQDGSPIIEWIDAVNNPEDPAAGTRKVPFSNTLYIEHDDFMLDPPKKFFRLGPGREARLRYAYWITCTQALTDDAGNVTELLCTYDPQTRGGDSPPPDEQGNVRKVKATLHWVSAPHAIPAQVRLYDRLFSTEQPDRAPKDLTPEQEADWSFTTNLNPDSLTVIHNAMLEPALAELGKEDAPANEHTDPDNLDIAPGRFQFERLGYFCIDADSRPRNADKNSKSHLVFNRTVTLKDSWAKEASKD